MLYLCYHHSLTFTNVIDVIDVQITSNRNLHTIITKLLKFMLHECTCSAEAPLVEKEV